MVDQIPDLVSDLKLSDRNVQVLSIELSKYQTYTQNEINRLSKELEIASAVKVQEARPPTPL